MKTKQENYQKTNSRFLFLTFILLILAAALVSAKTTYWIGDGVNLSIDPDNALFVDTTNNRVGIGTTNPTEKLDVSGNITAQGIVNGSGTPHIRFSDVTYFGSGSHNLGILNGPEDVHFAGDIEFDGSNYYQGASRFYNTVKLNDNVQLDFGNGDDSFVDWSTVQATEHTLVWGLGNTANSLIFTDSANSGKDFDHPAQSNPTLFVQSTTDPDTDNTEWVSLSYLNATDEGKIDIGKGNLNLADAFYINTSNNNIGIGTASPNQKLHVAGNVNISSGNAFLSDDQYLGKGGNTFYKPYDSTDGASSIASEDDINVYIDSDNNGATQAFRIMEGSTSYLGANEIMTVQQDGNVGIGTTSPTHRLDVSGNVSLNNTLFVLPSGKVVIGIGAEDKVTDTSNSILLINTSGTGIHAISQIGSSYFEAKNTSGVTAALIAVGYSSNTGSMAIDGYSEFGNGIRGGSTSGNGLWGYSSTGYGLYATATNDYAAYFQSLKGTYTQCPNGFTSINGSKFSNGRQLGCLQTNESGSANWHTAATNCYSQYGGRLPTSQELYIGWTNYSLGQESDDAEWTSDYCYYNGASQFGVRGATATTVQCAAAGGSYAYRCWLEK